MRPLRRGAAAWLVLVVVAASCSSQEGAPPVATLLTPGADVATSAGDPAPRFTAARTDGSILDGDDLEGRAIVVNFWLTTCEPCIRELPLLSRAASAHAGDGLVVIGVNPQESASTIDAFLASLDLTGSIEYVVDPDAVIARAFLVPAYPTTYFIDRTGTVRYRRFGEVEDEHLEVGLERTL